MVPNPGPTQAPPLACDWTALAVAVQVTRLPSSWWLRDLT